MDAFLSHFGTPNSEEDARFYQYPIHREEHLRNTTHQEFLEGREIVEERASEEETATCGNRSLFSSFGNRLLRLYSEDQRRRRTKETEGPFTERCFGGCSIGTEVASVGVRRRRIRVIRKIKVGTHHGSTRASNPLKETSAFELFDTHVGCRAVHANTDGEVENLRKVEHARRLPRDQGVGERPR